MERERCVGRGSWVVGRVVAVLLCNNASHIEELPGLADAGLKLLSCWSLWEVEKGKAATWTDYLHSRSTYTSLKSPRK